MGTPLKLNKKIIVGMVILLFVLLFKTGTGFSEIHKTHTQDGISCKFCHNKFLHSVTGVTGTRDASPRFLNLQGVADVPGPCGTTEATVTSGTTCNSVDCHGETAVTLISTVSCKDCHLTPASDVDNFVFGDCNIAKIDSTKWTGATSTGHGRLTADGAFPSGNPAPQALADFSSCTNYCHTNSVKHGAGTTNPFRLITAGGMVDFSDALDKPKPAGGQDDNNVCLDCHSVLRVNAAKATKHVEQNHFLTKHLNNQGQVSGGEFCWDCHDPHGDSNEYMIQDRPTKTTDGKFGVPATLGTVGPIVFTKAGGTDPDDLGPMTTDPLNYDWADFVRPTFDGLCQVCHSTTGGAVNFNANTFNTSHNNLGSGTSQKCTVCHVHVEDFGAGCRDCHNYTNINQESTLTFLTMYGAGNAVYAGWASNGTTQTKSSHEAHVWAGISCKACHGHNGSDPVPPNPPITHNPNNYTAITVPPAAPAIPANLNIFIDPIYYNGGNGSGSSAAKYNGVIGQTTTPKTCDNITCHFGLSPNWSMKTLCLPNPIISTISIASPTAGAVSGVVGVKVTILTGDAVATDAQYQVATDTAFTAIVKDWTSVAVGWDTSSAANGTYYIKVRVIDPPLAPGCANAYVYPTPTPYVTVTKGAVGPSAFTNITYYMNPSSGVALNYGGTINTTDVACGSALTTVNHWALLTLTPTTCATTNTTVAVATGFNGSPSFTAIRDFIRGDGVGTEDAVTITSYQIKGTFKASAAGPLASFDILDYDPATGTSVVLKTTATFAIGTADTNIDTGVVAVVPSIVIPERHKLGLRAKATGTVNTTHYITSTTGVSVNRTSLTISGTSSDGWALGPNVEPGSITDVTGAQPDTTGANVGMACNTCHEFGPDDAMAGSKQGGQYYYANAGSHAKHKMTNIAGGANANPTNAEAQGECTLCHDSDAIGGATWTNSHITGKVDIKLSLGYDTVAKTCATASCHKTSAGAQLVAGFVWGAPVGTGCFTCHAGTESAIKPQVTLGFPNPVDSAQYSAVGHGHITTPTNFQPAVDQCYLCHNDANLASHTDKSTSKSDPFRLGKYAQDIDGLCLTCHGTTSGKAINLDIQCHTRAIVNSGKYSWPFVPKCTDCHDPHGDANIMMIRSAINAPLTTNALDTGATKPGGGSYDGDANADGYSDYGAMKSTTIAPTDKLSVNSAPISVTFNSNASGKANGAFASNTPTGQGICEICHQQTTPYNRSGSSNSGSHVSNTGVCTACHDHKLGLKGAGGAPGTNCMGCHADIQGTRRDIQAEFDLTYQHGGRWTAPGVPAGNLITNADCELCHYADHATNTIVELKQWTGTSTYNTINYGGTATVADVNNFCLGCHSTTVAPLKTFANSAAVTPVNMATRWNNSATTKYNKYDSAVTATYNTVPSLVKSFSPHNFVATNKAKIDMDPGMTVVGCLGKTATTGCHPAHGSSLGSGTTKVTGVTPSALTTGITPKMLNDNGTATPYTLEEQLCWGCHADGMDYYGDNSNATDGTEWQGTWDNWPGSGAGTTPGGHAVNTTTWYKVGAFVSSHFYPSKNAGVTWTSGTPSGTRSNVYCSTCHNPHGLDNADDPSVVAPITVANVNYRAPILRGTWMTAPYKEDRAPGTTNTTAWINEASTTSKYSFFKGVPRATKTKDRANVNPGSGYSKLTAAPTLGFGWDGYFIDQNTLITGAGTNTVPPASTYITETDTHFAGICLSTGGCHGGATPSANIIVVPGSGWTGHNTVKGWDAVAGASFTNVFRGGLGTRANVATNAGGSLAITSATDGSSEWAMQWYGATAAPYNFQDDGPAGTRNNEADGTLAPRAPTITRWAYSGGTTSGNGVNHWGINYNTQIQTATAPAYVQKGYHKFPCSKCHTPHAARLQRLMRTNCLDNGTLGNYTGSYTTNTITGSHTPSTTTAYTTLVTNKNTTNFEAANCHSVAGSNSGGWNTITPW